LCDDYFRTFIFVIRSRRSAWQRSVFGFRCQLRLAKARRTTRILVTGACTQGVPNSWRSRDNLVLRRGAAAVDRGASVCLHQAFSSHEGRVPAKTSRWLAAEISAGNFSTRRRLSPRFALNLSRYHN